MKSKTPIFQLSTCARSKRHGITAPANSRFSRRGLAASIPVACALAVFIVAPVQAGNTYYWDVNGSGTAGFSTVVGAWNTGVFWNTSSTGTTGGTTTANPTSADDLIIPQATTKTGNITVTGSKSASSITFAANVGPTVNITGGTSITIGGTGVSSGIINLSSGANTVTTTLNLISSVTSFNFTNSGAGLLKIGSVNGLAASGTQTINIGTSSGAITLSGAFFDGAGGKVALNFNSSGTNATTLSGSGSTYTGGTTFTAGAVIANNTSALPSYATSGALVFSGGTLQLPTGTWATSDIDTLLSNATKTSGKLGLDTTTADLTQWTAFTTTNLGGLGLQKAGTNTLILNQTNTYTGATSITAGTLRIDTGGSIANTSSVTLSTTTQLVFNSCGSLSYGNVISGGSASATNVAIQNGGTVTLSGNNSFSGRLVVSDGTVSVSTINDNSAAGSLGGTNGGGGGATVLGGSGTTGTLEYTGVTAGPSHSFTMGTGGTGVFQIDNSSTVLSLVGAAASSIDGSGNLVKTGAGGLLLSRSTNSYSGATTVQAGSLIAGTNALGTGTTGAFGSSAAGAIVVGNGSTGASDAPALLSKGFTVGRDITVGSVSNANAYNATIGGNNTTGTATYSGSITLNTTASNYTVTLQAATGGTVDFNTGPWTTNNKAIAIGSSGNTGIVQLSNALTTSGGVSVNNGTLTLGNTLNVTGGTLAVATAGTLTSNSSGTVTGNATLTGGGIINLNSASGISGTLGVTGGNWNGAGTVTGGVTSSSGTFTVGSGANLTASGGLNVTGGTIVAGSSASTITGSINYTSSSNSTYAGVIAGSGKTVTMNASGATLTLTGTNSYDGATTVTNGKLVVNGNSSTSSLTTVASGATLGGSGTVGALIVSTGGFVTPGNSPGILTVNGNYTQAGQYTAEIAGTTAGTSYDQIAVTGTVDVTGGSLATAFSSGSYTSGDLLFILTNDGADAVTGSYAGYAQGAVVANFGGFNWQISYIADSTGNTFTGGNDIALSATTVPEPRAALLGGLGLLALLRRRRTR